MRVVSYTLQGGRHTDIAAVVIEADYHDGATLEIAVELEMNLQSFLATITAINKRLAALRP